MKVKSDREYAKILSGLLLGLPSHKKGKALEAFTVFLAKERVLKRIDRILSVFEKMMKEQEGITTVALTVARELSAETKKEIAKAFGKGTELNITIDPRLMGGFIALTKDERLDASVKGRLERFASHLLS